MKEYNIDATTGHILLKNTGFWSTNEFIEDLLGLYGLNAHWLKIGDKIVFERDDYVSTINVDDERITVTRQPKENQ